MRAQAIPDSVRVAAEHICEGQHIILTDCADYDTYCKLPAAIDFDGRHYALTGWNSDTGCAYYKTGHPYALALA